MCEYCIKKKKKIQGKSLLNIDACLGVFMVTSQIKTEAVYSDGIQVIQNHP